MHYKHATKFCFTEEVSASHTIEQESEFWLAYGREGRVTVVLCDTFEWALGPGPRAR